MADSVEAAVVEQAITNEWLRETYGDTDVVVSEGADRVGVFMLTLDAAGHVLLWAEGDNANDDIYAMILPHVRTREDFAKCVAMLRGAA